MRARQARLPQSGTGMLPATLAVALLLALVTAFSLLRWPNLLAYDAAVRATVARDHAARTVLVETPGRLFQEKDSDLPRLVEGLRAAGAVRILVLPPESGLHAELASRLATDTALAWGRPVRLQRSGGDAGVHHLAPLVIPEAGVALPPRIELGTARALPLRAMTDEGPRDSVVATVAASLGHDVAGDVVWVNFNNGREQLPRVNAEQVLSGTLPADLLRGRVAVVGLPLEEHAIGIDTPRSSSTGPLSPAEFQALALDTLLGDAGIRFLQGATAALLVIALFLLHVVLFQLVAATTGAALGLASLGLVVVAGLLLLGVAGVFLPLTEVALAIALAHALVHVYRGLREDDEVADLHARLRNKISARRFVTGFQDSQEPWQRLIALVNQHLTLTRSIFLETIPGEHRVREIASLNCSIDEIGERRRDFQRTPYSTALREDLPLELVKPYFATRNAAEREYMAALTYGGEVLGFWAFTVVPGQHWNREQFLRNTQAFATQISELLWQRRAWQQRQAREDGLPQRILTADVRRLGFGELRHSLAMIESRLDTLEDIFNGMSTAAALYDLFGQVVQCNTQMETMARTAGLPLYDMPVVELLVAVTGCSAEDARARLRHVVVQQQPVEIAAKVPGVDGAFLLRLRTLRHDTADARIHEAPRQPFELLGVLVELVDVTAARDSLTLARDLCEHVLGEIRRRIAAGADGEQVSALVNDSLALVGRSLQPVRDQALPLDASRALQRSVERAADAFAAARVALHLAPKSGLPLVLGDAVLLERVFEEALALLVGDAPANTQVQVSTRLEADGLHVTFRGNGFGIPQEKVDSVFRDLATPSLSTSLGRLRVARDRLREAGDDLEVASAPGEGYRVDIRLRPFRLGEHAL